MHKRAREQGATTTRTFPSLNLTLISEAPAMILFMLPHDRRLRHLQLLKPPSPDQAVDMLLMPAVRGVDAWV